MENNNDYKQLLFELYKHKNIDIIVADVLICLVFFIVNSNEKYVDIDIFNNSKSICYDKTSVLRFL